MSLIWVCDKCVEKFPERLTIGSFADRPCKMCGKETNWQQLNAVSQKELYTVEVKNADGETVVQGFHLDEETALQMAAKYGGTVTVEEPAQWPGVTEILK